MNSPRDTFVLRNGYEIPCIGFGTWQSPNDEKTIDAINVAIDAGYRHIDTAAAYDNEEAVGKAIKGLEIPRSEVFVTSKLWNSERGYDTALKAFDQSLKKLGLDYLDLYLIHWPAARGPEDEWQKTNSETWRAFEKLYKDGYVKAIGVSNFKPHHLEALMSESEIDPMVNQIEMHPGFPETETRDFCDLSGILVEAWSPLGSGRVLDDDRLLEIAANYGVTVAQLCIRWILQNGALPLPKSLTPERIRENADVFGFEISKEDMHKINELEQFGMSGLDPDEVTF
ncbi:aldo/keto reductase [Raoultibacter phocaeensis]|uniref:aldo/keto reductase n=1 Tax=Raoultibacter phocaeensis TaxID=2479841 RepID=UPI00111A88D5|nr:aldo/keto reductase [Raoultibacter phocaeensis]